MSFNAHSRTITVNRLKLIEQLKNNLVTHIKDHEEAVVGYQVKLVADLEKALLVAKSLHSSKLAEVKPVRFDFPRSYEKEYIDAIAMLEWSVGENIELDQTTFKQYVQNEWAWSQSFELTNTMYKAAAGAIHK
ncbi:hypothetical protein D3C87_278640 [compost metagenome]